jgi:hypothetical protein
MKSYDASNGWTIHPDSAFFVLDTKNPHVASDLKAIIVACDEAIADGCGDWVEILRFEAADYLTGEE